MLLALLAGAAGCASPPPKKPMELSLIDDAERALGTREALAAIRGYHSKTRGTFWRSGTEMPYTGEWWFGHPLKFRWRLQAEGSTDEGAIDGDAGWSLGAGGAPADLDPAHVRDAQQHAVESAILLIRPLRTKEFTITYAGPAFVAGVPTETLRVTWKGIVTRIVHFDPVTHLVVKTEGRTTLADEGEGDFELFVDRWTDQGGLAFPLHTWGLWNGEKRFDDECASIEWREPPADSVFRLPMSPER